MHKIYLILWKDLLMRKNHYILTALEILIPTFILLLINITSFPENESPNSEYMNDTIYPNCLTDEVDIFMKIIYEPQNTITKEIMSNVRCYGGFADIVPGKINNNSEFKIGVKFKGINDSSSKIPDSLLYELYPTAKYWDDIYELWKGFETKGYSYTTGQLKKFLRLQHAIDYSFLKMKNIKIPEISFSNMDLFSKSIRVYSVLVIVSFCFAFLFMVPAVVSRIVQEKSSGAKELMLLMGAKKWHLWVAKLIDSTIIFVMLTSFMVILLFIPLTNNSHVLTYVNPLLIWSFIMYGLIGILIFLFFVSCFFSNATVALYTTQLFWMFTLFIYVALATTSSIQPSHMEKLLGCLFPHICFLNGISIFLDFDFYGKPVRLKERLSGNDAYLTLLDNLLMIGFDIIFYSILTWYFEEVLPGKFGTPKSYIFCFKKSYWFPRKSEMTNEICYPEDTEKDPDFEFMPNGINAGIIIRNLSKMYKREKESSFIMTDVNIDFYEGEINALLGHNGAGKSTLLSTITGFRRLSSGKITINGYDLVKNTENARNSIGFCPQEDMLFNDLDVIHNIIFFAMIKGLSKQEALREADVFIKKFKLDDVKNSWVSTLSGGQKRKVSVAMAFIGGCKVVILDEPTSGMDVETRREVWDLLLKLRESRTILYTTHYMEEADILSDRIAIMSYGKIICYGSPMYLKSKYGSGYTLSLVINSTDKISEMTNFIKKFVKNAEYKSRNVFTLTYQLPEAEVSNFSMLLAALNEKEENKEISSYSVSFSTFEDVFLGLRYGKRKRKNKRPPGVGSTPAHKEINCSVEVEPSKVNECILPLYQFYALLEKKWIYFKRNIIFYLVCSMIPLLLIVAKLYIFSSLKPNDDETEDRTIESISYSLNLYRNSTVLYSSNYSNQVTEIFENLIKREGLELRKVSNIKKEIEDTFFNDFYIYARKIALAVEFLPNEIKVLYNSDATHILPASLNILFNSLLQTQYKNNYINTSVNLIYSYKEKKILDEYFETMETKKFSCSVMDIPDLVGIQTFFYLLGPLKENFQGAKQLQLMITSTNIYWISHLIFDLASFLVYLLICWLLFYFSSPEDFTQIDSKELILSFLLWAIGLILIAYLMSTLIENTTSASALYLIIYFCFSVFLFGVIRWQIWPMELKFLHPSNILKIGFLNICQKERDNYKTSLILYNIILYLCLIVRDSRIIENSFHMLMNEILKINYSEYIQKDSEVKIHEEYVKNVMSSRNFSQIALIVDNLKRWYFSNFRFRVAVQGISFAVRNGECFGLLGVNGAGKTTTFKLMTGLIPPSHGKAFMNEVNLFSPLQKTKALHQIGYCPQFGGLIPTLSGKEHLRLFARLRGVSSNHVARETLYWIEGLHLMEYANKAVDKYSGGNRRKVSVALSLIGGSSVIFLDEPTTGVDPVARRGIWSVINNLRKAGKSVVLTSHSMDECEALCTRVAIMVDGHFRCIEEVTTLKNKFTHGYSVKLKISLRATTEEFSAIKEAMLSNFGPECHLYDEHFAVFEYHITNNIKWDVLFRKLCDIKKAFNKVESFYVTSTTLEEIFIDFAKNK